MLQAEDSVACGVVTCVAPLQAGQDDAEIRIEDAAEQASSLLGVQFTRLVASSGFQLINVNNVAIELKVIHTPPLLSLPRCLVSQNARVSVTLPMALALVSLRDPSCQSRCRGRLWTASFSTPTASWPCSCGTTSARG